MARLRTSSSPDSVVIGYASACSINRMCSLRLRVPTWQTWATRAILMWSPPFGSGLPHPQGAVAAALRALPACGDEAGGGQSASAAFPVDLSGHLQHLRIAEHVLDGRVQLLVGHCRE